MHCKFICFGFVNIYVVIQEKSGAFTKVLVLIQGRCKISTLWSVYKPQVHSEHDVSEDQKQLVNYGICNLELSMFDRFWFIVCEKNH